MRCLFVTSLLPVADPQTGFEIANRAILEAYREAGAELTLAGFRRPAEAVPPGDVIDLGELAIENSGASRGRKMGWVARALAERLPVGAAKLRNKRAALELVPRLGERGPFDAVILNSVLMPAAFPFLATLAPFALVAHNVEYLSALGNAASAGSPVKRWLFSREAEHLETVERRLVEQAHAVHILAEADRAPLGLVGDARASVLALSVGRPAAVPDGDERDHDVGLIGTWSWAPNSAGLLWFFREVVPLLPETISVAVAGRSDGSIEVPARVRMVGRVADAQRFVRRARVVALATVAGTGIQLKTLETLEEGLPAVATPLALRGVEGRLPANVAVAPDARRFAEALAEAVRADREGRAVRLDGRAFRERQRRSAVNAVREGLERVAGSDGLR